MDNVIATVLPLITTDHELTVVAGGDGSAFQRQGAAIALLKPLERSVNAAAPFKNFSTCRSGLSLGCCLEVGK